MRIFDYELVTKLGTGAFGETWEAEHTPTKQRVAFKLLRAELTPRVDVRRFADDARAIARVANAGIARIHRFGQTEDARLFLVRDLVAGESLANRLQRGRMSSTQAADAGQQIARAMHALKTAGFVHHDLKPSNIRYILDPDRPGRERVIILDFGMAPVVGAAVEQATRAYLAPEQLDGGGHSAADVYALGCLLFEMICTRPPNGGSASSLVPDVSTSLDRLIALMLQSAPDRRPHSFSDVARLLDMIVGLEAPLAETVRS
jgi:serine/threonine protein kinase